MIFSVSLEITKLSSSKSAPKISRKIFIVSEGEWDPFV